MKEIYDSPRRMRLLKGISGAGAYLSAAFFGVELLLLLLGENYTDLIISAATALLGFVLVTLVRARLDKPRPYEVYTFYEIPPKDKKGHSFPSRHCYSAFVISALGLVTGLPVFIGTLVIAVAVAVCRVLTGMHFIRDVVVGALSGLILGGVGVLLCYLI